jgi:uncharacterized protein
MARPGQAHDQTMDEILASIRRMISEDSAGREASGQPKPVAGETIAGNVSALFPSISREAEPAATEPRSEGPPLQPDVAHESRLADVPASPPIAAAAGDQPEAGGNVVELAIAQAMEEAKAEVRAEALAKPPPEPIAASDPGEPVAQPAGPSTAALEMRASVQARIEARRSARVAEPLLSANSDAAVAGAFDQLAASMFGGAGRTIDELAADLLRPMLRDWLDDNLPPMVERLVREEIERVSRGRR